MKKTLSVFYFFLTMLPLFAYGQGGNNFDYLFAGDNLQARKQMRKIILSTETATAKSDILIQRLPPYRVLFQQRRTPEADYFIFKNESSYEFKILSAGSCVIKKDRISAKLTQMKLFIGTDDNSFLRFFPVGKRTLVQAVLLGRSFYQDIYLPLEFEKVVFTSWKDILRLSRYSIDWGLFFPNPLQKGHQKVEKMALQISQKLSFVRDREDGALDTNGYVYIDSLKKQPGKGGFNCSGFVKWIADGIYQTKTNRLLSVKALKQKQLDKRGSSFSRAYEKERDPYFGLDWTRNIALFVNKEISPWLAHSSESSDLRKVPFYRYSEDRGYPLTDLAWIMYFMMIKNPGRIYLLSVNMDFGKDPVLVQHIHTAVLFPYLDKQGRFVLRIFERGRETSLTSLNRRYAASYGHLVYLETGDSFRLPALD